MPNSSIMSLTVAPIETRFMKARGRHNKRFFLFAPRPLFRTVLEALYFMDLRACVRISHILKVC